MAQAEPAPPLLQGTELISLSELCGKEHIDEDTLNQGSSKAMYMKFRPFLTRRQKMLREHFQCDWCGVTSTPEMRPGPGGKKNALCNRCGLKYYRERREAKKNAANTKQKMSIEFLTTPADAKSETNGLA